LLARVSGVGEGLAQAIVAHRDEHGPFRSRAALKKVARLGPKAFEQCAGFLRIRDGDDLLDSSGVHPEAYPIVRKILEVTKSDIKALIGNASLLRGLKAQNFADETFGVPTITDIFKELEKPGRDPRPAFKTAEFREGVEKISDLEIGMMLEGVVTNVAAFGAFVDIGVHQDGLVHISALAEKFVKDPREVVKPGDIVKVKVMEVDAPRKRISLSMRMSDDPSASRTSTPLNGANAPTSNQRSGPAQRISSAPRGASSQPAAAGGALAEALRKAGMAQSGDQSGKNSRR
jgi:uncharacterized protein